MQRFFLLAGAVAVAGGALVASHSPVRPSETTATRVPVVVELFTSEGCSSCPAADALLLEVERTQPVAGVEVLALSEHVDYWNNLGWKDPFSAPLFTDRQQRYAAALHSGTYTPQAVVAGRQELIGSQRPRLLAAIAAAAREPQAKVQLTVLPGVTASTRQVQVQVTGSPATAGAAVLLAVTETGLSSAVGRGENAGRHLNHPAVVRALHPAGTVAADGTCSTTVAVPLLPAWQPAHLRLVALVQLPATRAIVGAEQISLRSPIKQTSAE